MRITTEEEDNERARLIRRVLIAFSIMSGESSDTCQITLRSGDSVTSRLLDAIVSRDCFALISISLRTGDAVVDRFEERVTIRA